MAVPLKLESSRPVMLSLILIKRGEVVEFFSKTVLQNLVLLCSGKQNLYKSYFPALLFKNKIL